MIVRIQHLRLCSIFLKQGAEEASSTSAVLCMVWSGGNGLEGDKLVK